MVTLPEKRSEEGGGEATPVVVCDGLSAQMQQASQKISHEKAFPISLFDLGVSFRCQEGAASVASDKERIIATIGSSDERLTGGAAP